MNDTCPAEQAIYLFIAIKRSNSQHIYPIATIDPANRRRKISQYPLQKPHNAGQEP